MLDAPKQFFENPSHYRALYAIDMKIEVQAIGDLRARMDPVAHVVAKACERLPGHISDHDLERYHLGMVTGEAELAELEEHLLRCGPCIDRAEASARYVDTVRAAACNLPE